MTLVPSLGDSTRLVNGQVSKRCLATKIPPCLQAETTLLGEREVFRQQKTGLKEGRVSGGEVPKPGLEGVEGAKIS